MIIGISALIDVAAVLVQLTAAYYALKLVRITGKSAAWSLICGALVLMATRRSIILYHFFIEPQQIDIWDFWDALVTLSISGAMLVAVLTIQPLFLTIKRAAETLAQAKEELEIKVAERTEELSDANNRLAVELEERRLAQEELARSNTELEQFAYVASHDLQDLCEWWAVSLNFLVSGTRGNWIVTLTISSIMPWMEPVACSDSSMIYWHIPEWELVASLLCPPTAILF